MKDLTVNKKLGRLIIELYDSIVPKTAKNFLMLCQQEENELNYKKTHFFWIVPGLYCLGGDVEHYVGLGGVSASNERYFEDENFELSHNAPGTHLKIDYFCSLFNEIIYNNNFIT